jgi:hypothetical protein
MVQENPAAAAAAAVVLSKICAKFAMLKQQLWYVCC